MPLHIDVKINEKLIERIHISRMTHNGMSPDSINEYAVVISESKLTYDEGTGLLRHGFPTEPDWLEWETSTLRFNHRYGDEATVCVLKALETVYPTHTHKSTADALADKVALLQAEVETLKALLLANGSNVDNGS